MASELEIRRWLATHRRNRSIAISSIPLGVALMVVTFGSPAMVIGIVGLLAGPTLAWVAHSYVRDAQRALGEAPPRNRLPTARIV